MKNQTAAILMIDDNEDILTAAKLLLKQIPYHIHTEKNPEVIPDLLKRHSFDVILLDMNFTRDVTSGQEGFHWLDKILEIDPSAIVVLITAFGDVETAVKAIKKGATDFVLKPWQNEKLLATLASAVKLSQSQVKIKQLEARQEQLIEAMDQPFHEMIGQSSAIKKIFSTIEKVAKTDASVLILGENGTGKELVARAIHRNSLRMKRAFISVDMGAIPETLFESELFGYLKGSFTDAKNDRAGKFEIASGGTLFLDEIGNLSIPMQAKLLRVIETQQVTRLGSNKPISFDVRLICATNRPLAEAIANQAFRQDFLFRINTMEIYLPPLRERREDIPLLVNYFIKQFAKKYHRDISAVEEEAQLKLQSYSWPGNIRELKHTIERAMIMTDSSRIKADDFLLTMSKNSKQPVFNENYNLAEAEKNILKTVLNKHKGNITHAARELGLTRTSLYRRMEKYGL
jgi:two-component system response regulator HydG